MTWTSTDGRLSQSRKTLLDLLVGKSQPRILFITQCLPPGKESGGQLRAWHVGQALKEFGAVSVVGLCWNEPDRELIDRTAAEFEIESFIRIHNFGTPAFAKRVRAVLDSAYIRFLQWRTSDEELARLQAIALRYDVIWIHSLLASYWLPQWSWPSSVIDVDDLPSSYERTVFRAAGSWRNRLGAAIRTTAWQRREGRLQERFSVAVVCSEADRKKIRGGIPTHVVPNGFESPSAEPSREPTKPPRIGFMGPMSFLPNRQGVEWFVRECWPRIKQSFPTLRLRLVGRGWDSGTLNGPEIDGLGWLEDPSSEIATWSGYIVPIHIGAGTRLKVAEAFGRKCPIVSTRLGSYGYEVSHRAELCLADEARDFAEECIWLLKNAAGAHEMAERAWRRFRAEWTWESIAPRAAAAAEDCLRRSRRSPQPNVERRSSES